MVIKFFKKRKKISLNNIENENVFNSDTKDYSKIQTIEKSCPICRSDVKGNDLYLFYCKKCNLLFKKEELFLDNPERLKSIVKKSIIKNYINNRDVFLIEEKKIPLKIKKDMLKNNIFKNDNYNSNKDLDKITTPIKYYVSSTHSKLLHTNGCVFVEKISEKNKVKFLSLEDALKIKKYNFCKCINKS